MLDNSENTENLSIPSAPFWRCRHNITNGGYGPYGQYWIVLHNVSLCLIFLLGLAMNLLICCVFYRRPYLLTPSHAFILSLACCDLGIIIFVVPFSLVSSVLYDDTWPFGGRWCSAQAFLSTMFFTTMSYNLTVVSVDRYCAIVLPLRYPNIFTNMRGYIMISIMWVMAILLALPPLLGWGSFVHHKAKSTCFIDWSPEEVRRGYPVFFGANAIGVPVLIMLWCYIHIFIAAVGHLKRARKIEPRPPAIAVENDAHVSCSRPSSSIRQRLSARIYRSKQDCKAVRTIVLIGLGFMLCWIPYCVISCLEAKGRRSSEIAQSLAMTLAYSACALNPFIYGVLNRIMRTEMVKLLKYIVSPNQGSLALDIPSTIPRIVHSNRSNHNYCRSVSENYVGKISDLSLSPSPAAVASRVSPDIIKGLTSVQKPTYNGYKVNSGKLDCKNQGQHAKRAISVTFQVPSLRVHNTQEFIKTFKNPKFMKTNISTFEKTNPGLLSPDYGKLNSFQFPSSFQRMEPYTPAE